LLVVLAARSGAVIHHPTLLDDWKSQFFDSQRLDGMMIASFDRLSKNWRWD